ncbi:MAG TPA: hypothetical protein VN426_08635 [Syntrophomonadaceae bacterium]|nr:hypothetical protein [Syntrophomonadaceae bacterium]
MKFDKPLLAAIMGSLSTIPSEFISRIFISQGIGKYSVYQLDSLIVTMNRPNIFMGLILNLIIGGFIATVFYYLLEKIGQDYLVLKCAGISIVAWGVAETIFTATIEGKYIDIRPISDYYVHIIGAFVFGITLGLLFKQFLFTNTLD